MKEPASTDPPGALRAIAGRAPVGVFSADAEGRWTYANAACQAIFGLAPDQALGFGWLQGVHADEREALRERWLREARSTGFVMQHRVRRPDGGERTVITRLWSLDDPHAPTVFVGAVTDITERVAMERRLGETLELLDRTGRLSRVGGWVIDLEQQTVRWSEQTCRIHEVPVGHVPTVEEGIRYWAPEAQPVVRAIVENMISRGDPCDFELPMVTAKGRHVWVHVVGEVEWRDGRAVRLFGATEDTTARRAAEQELRDSRERLRRLYDETPALLASADAEGRVLSISNRLLARLGLARDAVVGQPGLNLLHAAPGARAAYADELMRLAQQPGGLQLHPVRLRHGDGSAVHALLSATAEHDADGRLLRVLAVFDDISEDVNRRAELARERALREELERQAAELSRLADERREMLDVLAHEVRQPLNNASAALQSAAAASHEHREGEALERLARAQGVIGVVVAQIDNTLAAAALLVGTRPLERADTDIDTLLQLVIADFAPAERARIVIDRRTGTRTASMDLSLMRLALRNLLANALRHAPPGSPVTLRVSDSDEPLALLLDVIDRGPGVPVALRDRLFERGVRSRASRGQGLGLYIARRALQLHGGTAELLSGEPGETAFRLVLAQDGDAGAYSTSGALNT